MNRPILRNSTLALVVFLLSQSATGRGDEGGGGKPRVGEKGERERVEAWDSLSPEQREKLRQALREVWTDPAVINAREEVKHASDAYQSAIKAAMERSDPSVTELLSKIQGAGGMGVPGFPGSPGGPGGSGNPSKGPMRGFDEQIKPPGFLDSLPPEAREKFRKAEEAAMDSEAVKAARAELEKIREEDEALRRKRVEAHRKLRKVTVEEMIRIDPSIEAMQKRLWNGERSGAPGQPPRKEGEGKPGKSTDPVPAKKGSEIKGEDPKPE